MSTSLTYALLVLGSYLLGSVPAGLIVAKAKGVDIRKVGSGNIGATNVFRQVGKGWGILTFVLDAAKGFVPAMVFPLLAGLPQGDQTTLHLALACGCAAIAGHNWSVFLRFTGGKGVATSAGVLLGIVPLTMLIGLVVWIILLAATGYVAVASMGAGIAIPVAGWIQYGAGGVLLPAILTLLGILIVVRHRSNIQRLVQGTEHRFGAKGKKPPKETGQI